MKNRLKLFSLTSAKDSGLLYTMAPTFTLGQIDVTLPSSAVIKFLAPTKGKNDYFWWPLSDDIVQVESTFVYRWNFDVMPISNDGKKKKQKNLGIPFV